MHRRGRPSLHPWADAVEPTAARIVPVTGRLLATELRWLNRIGAVLRPRPDRYLHK